MRLTSIPTTAHIPLTVTMYGQLCRFWDCTQVLHFTFFCWVWGLQIYSQNRSSASPVLDRGYNHVLCQPVSVPKVKLWERKLMKDCLRGKTLSFLRYSKPAAGLWAYTRATTETGAWGVGRREGDGSRRRQRERERERVERKPGWVPFPGERFPPAQPAPWFPHAAHARSAACTGYHLRVMKRRIFVCNTAPKCQPISSFHESPRETRICLNSRRQIAVRQLKRCSQLSSDHVGFLSALSLWSEGEHFTPGWSQTTGEGGAGGEAHSHRTTARKRPKPLRHPLWELQDHINTCAPSVVFSP